MKVNQISFFQPTKLWIWKQAFTAPSKRTHDFYRVQSEWRPAGVKLTLINPQELVLPLQITTKIWYSGKCWGMQSKARVTAAKWCCRWKCEMHISLICMWQSLHQCVICLSPLVNGTLWREADSENAVEIRVITTYWILSCIMGTATGLIPVLFHFCLIRWSRGSWPGF